MSLAFDPDQLDGRPGDQVIRGEDKKSSVILTNDELLVTQQLISKCYSYCRVSVAGTYIHTLVYLAVNQGMWWQGICGMPYRKF